MSDVVIRPANCSDAEWALREQLAYCYRLVDFFGWTETIFNHISARLPGPAHHYLVNPFGLNYSEVTPANLLKVDLDGNKLDPSEYDANPAGFALHSAVHGARDDIHCLMIGAAGVSAVPMAARVVQREVQREYPGTYLLMHAMGPNVAGVIGTAVAAGAMLTLLTA